MIDHFRFLTRQYYWIAILLIPLMLLVPGLTGFPYPPSPGAYSDISITHYPNAFYLRNAILNDHNLPLWSSTILSGYPFHANPLSGLWYPPGWLAFLQPLPLGFNVTIFIHLLWAGVGMLFLLREEQLSTFPALFGAVAFTAMPKLFAHYGAGHLTLLYAIAWTPWLLLTSRRYFFSSHPAASPTWRRILSQPALVWALILLADVRWAAFVGLLWWYYVLIHKIFTGWKDSFARFIVILFTQTFIGILLAAPLILPLFEYAGLSTRANMGAGDVLIFSLPPIKILGLVFPDFGGFYEWVVYCGTLVLLLSIVALARAHLPASARCWIGAVLLSFLFALGSYIPFIDYLAKLPGINLLRVPSRMIFITGFGLAALAAHQIQWLTSGLTGLEIRRLRLIFAGWMVFILFLAAGAWMITGKTPVPFIWSSIFTLAAIIWLMMLQGQRVKISIWQLGLLAICLIDLIVVDLSLFVIRPGAEVLAEGTQVARYLNEHAGEFRIYSPSYSLPQQTSARFQLEMASGVDPLQLQSYAEFMEAASGVPLQGYSVVLPPMVGEGQFPDETYIPDARLLGILNVGYVLTNYRYQVDGLEQEAIFDDLFLYKNRFAMGRAWVEANSTRLPTQVVESSPNRIKLKASGPGLLYLSEVYYPGWRAWVDGEPVPITEGAGTLRSIELDSGEHMVVYRYIPLTQLLGLALLIVGILLVVLVTRGWS